MPKTGSMGLQGMFGLGAQTYQSRLGSRRLERDVWNHGCSLEV